VVSTRTKTPNGKTDVLIHAPRKLDIACGQRKQAGYKGIDIAGNPDIVHDLNDFPWPIKTSSVKEVFCSHYVEHIPHWMPGWERDGWWMFFDELYRIMAKGATALFFHPYAKSDRAFWDPTHTRYVHVVLPQPRMARGAGTRPLQRLLQLRASHHVCDRGCPVHRGT
jgi:hypothetical protein